MLDAVVYVMRMPAWLRYSSATSCTRLSLTVMLRLVMRLSLGWWASACAPPTTIAPAESWSKMLPTTLMPLAPSPTPVAWALASLPMPTATWPRSVNRLSVNVTVLAADTWTAAGIWRQLGRAASNAGQPDWQELSQSDGRFHVP